VDVPGGLVADVLAREADVQLLAQSAALAQRSRFADDDAHAAQCEIDPEGHADRATARDDDLAFTGSSIGHTHLLTLPDLNAGFVDYAQSIRIV
jgi:hypothetical protein